MHLQCFNKCYVQVGLYLLEGMLVRRVNYTNEHHAHIRKLHRLGEVSKSELRGSGVLHLERAVVDGWQCVWNSSVVDTCWCVGGSFPVLSKLNEDDDNVYEHPGSCYKRHDTTPRRCQFSLSVEVDVYRMSIQITLSHLFVRLLGLFQSSFTYSLFRHFFILEN